MEHSHYKCLRCGYNTRLRSDMKRHLERKIKCCKLIDSYSYTDDEIYEKSLTMNVMNSNADNRCVKCDKLFSRSFNLKRHQNTCKKSFDSSVIDDNNNITENFVADNITNNIINNITNNITNNTNNTKIENNVVIVQNNIKSFDEPWSVEHLDTYLRFLLLISKSKYTDLLTEILNNKDNLNVIIEKGSDSGLVYKNDKEMYVKMKMKEIMSHSMNKLYEQLNNIYNDYLLDESKINTEINLKNIIKKEKDKSDKKYDDYINDDNIKGVVNDYLVNIYHLKKEEALELTKCLDDDRIGY
jgi:hypothetical protein